MGTTKIVMIGAGSTSFGMATLRDILAHADALRGSTIVLNDVSKDALDLMLQVARGMDKMIGSGLAFEATIDQRAALDGAEFVIIAVEADRMATWKQDWEIPLRHGVKQVLGENGGPGGLGHTLRAVSLVLRVARNVEEIVPGAWVFNFTNPMSRVCLALKRATTLKVVGLCHQIGAGYLIVAQVLGLIGGEQKWNACWRDLPQVQERIDLKAAGLNHFTFIYDIRDRRTGRSLYPEFRERLAAMPADFEPLSRRLLDAFGYFPATGDGHVGEYISFAWETSDLRGFDFEAWARRGEESKANLREAVARPGGLKAYLGRTSGERAIPIVDAILHDKNRYEMALNIPNHGTVLALPDWAIVEVPAVVSGAGISGLTVPAFPPALTAPLTQQVAVQDRAVEAAIYGGREAALQSLLLDPVVTSYEAAVRILDDLLAVHAPYLPQFRSAGSR